MKKILLAVTMVVALTLTAAAAGKKPSPAANPNGYGVVPPQLAPPGIPPALCHPCLFYGGDLWRVFIGLTEFTVLVTLSTPVSLTAGEYWFNITPTCTNGAVDGSCYVGRMFFSNTTSGTNNVNGHAQPGDSLFLNSTYFGFVYEHWCSLVSVAGQCHLASFGS